MERNAKISTSVPAQLRTNVEKLPAGLAKTSMEVTNASALPVLMPLPTRSHALTKMNARPDGTTVR